MLKQIGGWLVIFSIVSAAQGRPPRYSPRVHFCNVLGDWKSGEVSDPKEFCAKYGGSFCQSMENAGQAICAATGQGACLEVKSIGEGICRAGGGSFCRDLTSESAGYCSVLRGNSCKKVKKDKSWYDKIREACTIRKPMPVTTTGAS